MYPFGQTSCFQTLKADFFLLGYPRKKVFREKEFLISHSDFPGDLGNPRILSSGNEEEKLMRIPGNGILRVLIANVVSLIRTN